MRPYCKLKGFTLIETLVAVALTSVIIVMLMFTLQSGANGTRRLQGAISAEEEGRIALQSIVGDIRRATNWEQAYMRNMGSDDAAWSKDEIGFYVHISPERQAQNPPPVGTLCFVHYYLDEAFEFPGERGRFSRILFRRVLNSAEVRSATESGETIDSTLNRNPERDPMIAFDIVSMRIDGRANVENGVIGDWNVAQNLPREISVELVVATELLASSLLGADDWENSERLGSPAEWPVSGLELYKSSVLLSSLIEEKE